MSGLGIERFDEFFRELNGKGIDPFPWQKRLAKRVVGTASEAGSWPQVLALPTASGKTACIDIAVFALACQAHLPPEERSAPRRIFFVVDRRVIVDEAMKRAEAIRAKLSEARSGILYEVAEALRSFRVDAKNASPLECYRMRGGLRRENEWTRDPLQPAIITSTVDQFGSRLLFRGYGVSRYMRPIHAALAGNDCLVILDEAHCARPFSETMAAIRRYRTWADNAIQTPFQLTLMTATPQHTTKDVFTVDNEDMANPALSPRLSTPKPTKLVEATTAKGAGALRALSDELAIQALEMRAPQPKAIAIMVNRVPTARLVYSCLKSRTKDDVVLVTGRMRPIDRDDVAIEWLSKLDAATSTARRLERNVFVVSTQCLEVGANLDFDGMVSECASLDSLRQRFGRLNRMGRSTGSLGTIVIRSDQTIEWRNPDDEDPIYGNALPRTWKWLSSVAKSGVVDMGFLLLNEELEASGMGMGGVDQLGAPSPNAPVIVPAYIDCWIQTSPEPSPEPEISDFLHGPKRGLADIEVSWRADLDANLPEEDVWIDTVALRPPSSSEFMPVPPHVFRQWFAGAKSPDNELTDVEGASNRESESQSMDKAPNALVWRGSEDSFLTHDSRQIMPGDTVVLPASIRGWEIMGHVPIECSNPAEIDRADEARLASGAPPTLGLHPALLSCWPNSVAKLRLLKIISRPDLQERIDEPEFTSELREALDQLAQDTSTPNWLREAASLLSEREHGFRITLYPGGNGFVLRSILPFRGANGSGRFSHVEKGPPNVRPSSVTLWEHSEHVRRVAEKYATGCLAAELRDPIVHAAHLHDLGKADRRFQALLHGGDVRAAAAQKCPLAKSDWIPLGKIALERARIRAGYPSKGRHEFLSVRLAEQLKNMPVEQDLVLHLIASHHGRCRPFAPSSEDKSPCDVSLDWMGSSLRSSSETNLERLESGVPDRFWEQVRRFGWWGEAYLEALVRLADHRASELESTTGSEYNDENEVNA